MSLFSIRVRHNKSHAVWVDLRATQGGYVLERVRPLDGPLPEYSHLQGETFPDVRSVRLAVLAAMRGVVGDTLDNVRLSMWAYTAWVEVASRAASGLGQIDPDSIPDEMAKPLPNGDLLIWVDLPDGNKATLNVPKGHWEWKKKPH